jgi:cyclomaltodextrinase
MFFSMLTVKHWAYDSVFYHIYPLGLCGAPLKNDFSSPVQPRLEQLYGWLDHLVDLGVNALYLGPLFESTSHGYDTADYFRVDRRLGSNETLARLSAALHQKGIRLVLDGVFNHVGRDFWAFRDMLERREQSAYRDWFQGLDFGRRSPYNDPFAYEGWNGHYSLVKLNLRHPAVKEHLFQAVEFWLREFDINGLRLDAADCMDITFLKELATFCKSRRPDFWLMGEVIHGDYRRWANAQTLDSVTNYECYKGLYSSHMDKNYFEIAYALNHQFGEGGLYRDLPLYAFADNHDVNRVASNLANPLHLYPLYTLLFTMPGVPSIYYGSEWGIQGKRNNGSDLELRPRLDLNEMLDRNPQGKLVNAIQRLAGIRLRSKALRYGNYRQLCVSHEQFAFARQTPDETVIVAVNASDKAIPFEINLSKIQGSRLRDLLNEGECFPVSGRQAHIEAVRPCWARIMCVE